MVEYEQNGEDRAEFGIVLCRRKNDALVELTLSSDANIFASKYQLYLPSKQELKAQVEKVQAEMEHGGIRPIGQSLK